MGKWLNGAKKQRETMNKAGTLLDDREASYVVSIYPEMQYNGKLIRYGTRINWNGEIKKAKADLWDTRENTPDAAPNLWSRIDYKDGYRIIPDSISADLGFPKGERGWWEDVLHESVYEGLNVWTPEQYPAGWKEVVE